jgi:integrase
MACVRYRRGRWIIDFYDQDGKRRWHTMPKGSTKKDANIKKGTLEKKVQQGAFTPPKDLPLFVEVADNWLASKEPNIRHNTYEQYKGHLENHLKPYFRRAQIHQLGFEAIEKFKNDSLKKGTTPPTLHKILVNLGAILAYAVKMRYIDFNPAAEVEKPKISSSHEVKEIVVLHPEEIQRLLTNAGDLKSRVLFMAAVLTGMRQGELLGLKWGDIDWKNRQIHVRRTFNHRRFYKPKTKASRRRVDLAPHLVAALKEWKLASYFKAENDLVFPDSEGKAQNHTMMLRHSFQPTLERAGLPRMRFHDLRHTYASMLIKQGENIKYIQAQLGHSSINMTMDVYGHLMDTVNQEAANRLGKFVFGDSEDHGSSLVAVPSKEGKRS